MYLTWSEDDAPNTLGVKVGIFNVYPEFILYSVELRVYSVELKVYSVELGV
jgi:hypothetical protein